MSEPLRTVNVGLIGLGTVGGGVARLIKSHHDEYLAAYGIDLKLTRACALAWEQAEAAGIEREAFTSDWHDVVTLHHCQQEPLEPLQGLAEIKHVYLDRQKSDL